jgi:glycosyltransferase involved in cell wall biosynthesis
MDSGSRESGQIYQEPGTAEPFEMISIFVLTLNEETNIRPCLESVRFSDDVVVLDSFSTDRTVEIAAAMGARVFQRKFDNWAAHQNIAFKHDWVFYLDADERMTPELQAEIIAIASDKTNPHAAYYCGRKNYFMDKWIKHAMPPGEIMRFFKPPHIRFERLVNPVPVLQGTHGYLKNYFLHYNFSKGLVEWFIKHNNYSRMEAMEGLKIKQTSHRNLIGNIRGLFSSDRAQSRKALKAISFLLPGRTFLRFFYAFFLKLGFLDGITGFQYCMMISMYEYWIDLKIIEHDAGWRSSTEAAMHALMKEPQ